MDRGEPFSNRRSVPARFGPTTPKRAGRLADASVDPTEVAGKQLHRSVPCCTFVITDP
jgi:hypothetical protein